MDSIKAAWNTIHALPATHRIHESPYDFDETVEKLTKGIESEGLWVLHKIEAHKLLAKGGYEIRRLTQLLFFHPDYMAQILQTDINAPIEAPLKFLVMEMEGDTVTVRYKDPVSMFDMYKGLAALGGLLSEKIDNIIATALGVQPK